MTAVYELEASNKAALPVGFATKIHGISDEMVLDAPTLEDLWPTISGIIQGNHVVIYSAQILVQIPVRLFVTRGHLRTVAVTTKSVVFRIFITLKKLHVGVREFQGNSLSLKFIIFGGNTV